MAFLDNSGDTILDATLTLEGRKALARGTFKIVSFTLADDEIDYSKWDGNHASGSAYYDLRILQTPVFVAHTQQNVNYPLRSITNQALLYVPTVVLNEKTDHTAKRLNEMYYMAANAETFEKMKEEIDPKFILRADDPTAKPIFVELGIDSTDKMRTAENAKSLIGQNNLSDASLDVDFDPKVFSGFLGTSTLEFSNEAGGAVKYNQGPLKLGTRPRRAKQRGQMCTSIRTAPNGVVDRPNANFNAVAAVSSCRGPADSCAVMIPSIAEGLKANSAQATPETIEKYGTKASTVTSLGSKLWDTLDTTIKATAPNGGGSVDIAVKYVRYSSG